MPIDQARLRKLLAIDKNALDDCIIENPQLVLDVGDAHAEAIGVRDTLKEKLAVTDAELDEEIRESLKDKKATEGAIKAMILMDKKHTQAFTAYIRAKTDADKLAALKTAYDDRREALRDLAKLYLGNYFDHSTVQGTSSEDKIVYQQRRRIIAEQRGRRAEK
jgi:hypothetical protein